MKGQETPGEILELKGNRYIVAFGSIRSTVSPGQVEKISRDEYRRRTVHQTSGVELGEWNVGIRRLNFKPHIDLRGKRAEEAIRMLNDFIDEAVMGQAGDLPILHGKGNGILRELIRQQLKANSIVQWFGDEHVERGGAGITLVRLAI